VTAYNGDPTGVRKIVADSTAVRQAVDSGTAKMKASAAITIYDLIHIGGPLFVMENKISELMDALKSKKADLTKAGADKTILAELQNDKVSVDGLNAAVGQNLPFPGFLSKISDPIGKLVANKLTISIKEWGGL